MKVFYHNDMDGKCAGAIVYQYHKNNNEKVECIPMDYTKEFPLDNINKNELIYIVDFSLQKEGDFKKLLEITSEVVWIDHHKTAIEKNKHLYYLKGLRMDGTAGCQLTWEYFYNDRTIPHVVKLLADYDVWTYKFGEETSRLQSGIQLYNTEPTSNNWETWLKGSYFPSDELKDGEVVLKYQEHLNKNIIERFMFTTTFEGYKAVCCNAGNFSSKLFDTVTEDYDIMIPFVFDGKQWTVSLYTKKDIDVSEIAKKYGGGGHKKASGFVTKELLFKA